LHSHRPQKREDRGNCTCPKPIVSPDRVEAYAGENEGTLDIQRMDVKHMVLEPSQKTVNGGHI